MTLVITLINIILSGILTWLLVLVFGGNFNQLLPISYVIVWIYVYNKSNLNDFGKFTMNFWQVLFFISMFILI